MISKTMVINDLHRPFHDVRSVNLVLDVFEDTGCEHLILNGDVMDFYNINSHGPTHPVVGTLLEDEIADTRIWLDEVRKRFPKIRITYLFGNHEDRLERFILANAAKLFPLLRLHKMLGLKELGIEWFPYNHRYRLGKSDLYIQHSPPSYAKNGAMTSLDRDVDESSIYGCSHREQKAVKSGKSGKQYYCFFNGWLGSTNATAAHEKVFSYVKGHQNWQQCFCLVTLEGRDAHVQQVSIKGNKAFCEGYLYEG